MNQCYLSLGSNLGDRIENLKQAYRLLEDHGQISRKSSWYASSSWGYESSNDFINSCVLWETALEIESVIILFKEIEQQLGRNRSNPQAGYADRVLDIDLIFFNQLVYVSENVQVPHPLYSARKFVLLPLEEIASGFVDPLDNKTINEVLEACSDASDVRKFFE